MYFPRCLGKYKDMGDTNSYLIYSQVKVTKYRKFAHYLTELVHYKIYMHKRLNEKHVKTTYYGITLSLILNHWVYYIPFKWQKKKVIDSYKLTSQDLRNQGFKVSSRLDSFPPPVNTSCFVDVSLGLYVLAKLQQQPWPVFLSFRDNEKELISQKK